MRKLIALCTLLLILAGFTANASAAPRSLINPGESQTFDYSVAGTANAWSTVRHITNHDEGDRWWARQISPASACTHRIMVRDPDDPDYAIYGGGLSLVPSTTYTQIGDFSAINKGPASAVDHQVKCTVGGTWSGRSRTDDPLGGKMKFNVPAVMPHAVVANFPLAATYTFSTYVCCDTYSTVFRINPDYYMLDDYIYVRQIWPNSSCRYRLMYRTSGTPDWHNAGVKINPAYPPNSGFANAGDIHADYLATYVDLQVLCGTLFNGNASGYYYFD